MERLEIGRATVANFANCVCKRKEAVRKLPGVAAGINRESGQIRPVASGSAAGSHSAAVAVLCAFVRRSEHATGFARGASFGTPKDFFGAPKQIAGFAGGSAAEQKHRQHAACQPPAIKAKVKSAVANIMAGAGLLSHSIAVIRYYSGDCSI
jgi:hypothetical protein